MGRNRKSKQKTEVVRSVRLNNVYMYGADAIDPAEQIALVTSSQNTSVHMHDFIEIVYFTHGEGHHYIAGQQYDIFSGCVCIINRNVKHYYSSLPNVTEGIKVKNLIFYPAFIGYDADNFLDVFMEKRLGIPANGNEGKPYVQMMCDPNGEIEQCFKMIERELCEKRDNYLLVVRCLLETLLILLVSQREPLVEGKKHNKRYAKIEESIEYLNQNICNTPSMKDVAKKYGFSSEYYSKLFREFTGKNYTEFVQQMKCNEVVRLLLVTDYTNERISEMCGFSSVKYFHQQFKRFYGMTPRAYVKRYAAGLDVKK